MGSRKAREQILSPRIPDVLKQLCRKQVQRSLRSCVWLRDAMQGLLCLSHPQPRKTAISAESTFPKQAKTVPAARRMVLVNAEQEGRKHIVLSRLPAGASGHGGRVYLFNRMSQGFSCICFSFSHTQNFRKSQAPRPHPSDSVSVALRWNMRLFRLQKVLFQM